MSSTPIRDVLSGRRLSTTFVHHASGSDNEIWKNPQKYFYGELIAGKRHPKNILLLKFESQLFKFTIYLSNW